MNDLDTIASKLVSAGDITITSHLRPDGDALGSELALARMLTIAGKTVRIQNPGDAAHIYHFLPGVDDIETVREPPEVPPRIDLLVVLDSPHPNRLGGMSWAIEHADFVISIDHHPGSETYGDLNYADSRASSVGEILVRLAETAPFVIDQDVAVNLLTSLYTDTGRFTHANTTPETFRAAARLAATGVDLAGITDRLYKSNPVAVVRMRGEVMQNVQLMVDGCLAWVEVTQEMFDRYGVKSYEIQDVADIPRSLEGVQIGVLFQEMEPGTLTKASFRSKGHADVNTIARQFGGGGHKRAAGVVVKASLEQTRERILEGCRAYLETQRGGRS